jgi:DNA-binding NarL/FixJ family response regulator
MQPYLQSVGTEAVGTEAANRQPYVDVAKLRVIIVEDSAIIRARLAESIGEMSNVEIVGQVETEADALALLKEARWDAAVLDLQLKQGTGLGVLKSLAHGARPANTKIIVFTNYAFPQYRDRSLSLGADYFFDKAREFHRVREVLNQLAGNGGSSVSH